MLAVVFAILFHIPYEKLTRLLGGQKNIAAGIVVTIVLIFFIVPLFFLGSQILQDTKSLYARMQGNGAQYIKVIEKTIEDPVRRIMPNFSFNANEYISGILNFVSNNLGVLISQTFYVMLKTFLMLLAFFFFLRDGRKILLLVTYLSPFQKKYTDEVLDKTYQTIDSVMRGTFFITLIRWVVIGVGFYLFGIPDAVLWGSVGGIIGAVPGIGTLLVFIPAVVYMYLQGNTVAVIGLIFLGIATIVFVDNMLTSYFFGRGLEVPSIFVLFSILGGVMFFGPLGFIFGPLVLSIFLSLLHIYGALMSEKDVS
jgi:predicted PurR-regulated permease PerM